MRGEASAPDWSAVPSWMLRCYRQAYDCGCRRPRPILLFCLQTGPDVADCADSTDAVLCSGLCQIKPAHPPRSQLRLQHESAGMACCSGLSTLRTDLCRIRICSRI